MTEVREGAFIEREVVEWRGCEQRRLRGEVVIERGSGNVRCHVGTVETTVTQ